MYSGHNGQNAGQAAARRYAEVINMVIIAALSRRRVFHGKGLGQRPTPGAARGAVDLVEIEEVLSFGAAPHRITEVGQLTARRHVPAVLARLDARDPRRLAAEVFATSAELIGSVAGAALSGDTVDGGGGPSDGGASARVDVATKLRIIEAAANGWSVSRQSGKIVRGPDLQVLRPSNKRGDRMAITAMGLLSAVCIDGRDMAEILQAHGWSGQGRDVSALIRTTEDLLDLVACALGLQSAAAIGRGFDR
jgi:hypothetical protein